MRKIIKIYSTQNGRSPFLDWLNGIKDKVTRARIRRRLDRMEIGHYGDYKSLGSGIYELRLQFGAGYRIYFAEIDDVIILLLCGGDKSSQVADIKKANKYWQEIGETYDD